MALPDCMPFPLMCGLIFTLLLIFRCQQLKDYGLEGHKLGRRRELRTCSRPPYECFIPVLHAYVEYFSMEAFIARRAISEWYVKPRTLQWWNHYVGFVPGDDKRFRSVFRLPLCLFQNIVELLRTQLQQGDIPISLASIKGRVLSVEKQVAIGLFRLATGTSMLAMSELFGVGKSTVVESFDRFVKALLVHRRQYISWPRSSAEIEKIKAGFFLNQGLPNVCGAMDATHIVMEKPQGGLGLDWYDRSKDYSMLLQAVVDSDMHFWDVFAGFPGSVNDTTEKESRQDLANHDTWSKYPFCSNHMFALVNKYSFYVAIAFVQKDSNIDVHYTRQIPMFQCISIIRLPAVPFVVNGHGHGHV